LVRDQETLEDAAKRIYTEATKDTPLLLEQLYTFSDPKRDPRSRSISTAYFTFPKKTGEEFLAYSKYLGGKWWNVKDIPKLAYDHNEILEVAFDRIASKLNYTTIALLLLPEEFTLTELQGVYEYFSKKKIDKRNFRNKILSLRIAKETGEFRKGEHRPAKLYIPFRDEIEIISLFS